MILAFKNYVTLLDGFSHQHMSVILKRGLYMALETPDMIIDPIETEKMAFDYQLNGKTIRGTQLFYLL